MTDYANNITYNTAGLPTSAQTSCGGSTCYPINYTYDSNTLRITEYSATFSNNGGTTISGTLTWNPNGSLQQLLISDPLNSLDAQTCSYSADDLARTASVNCMNGSTNVWAQNFTYDAFGNITKSVPANGTGINWMPGYNTATNHYTLGGTSYDADGNVLTDTFNTYTWDAEGRPLSTSAGGSTLTFLTDAFGHQVEASQNGNYQYSYLTLGKFQLIATGQTAFHGNYPMVGGSIDSDGGGSTVVKLGDWLGTVRAWMSYTGGSYAGGTVPHAPFGESYNYASGYPTEFTGQPDNGSFINTIHYFPERRYASTQGRWLSPDPSGTGAVDPNNPQSWNRYAYVNNSPLNAVDPNGLDCIYVTQPSHQGAGGTYLDPNKFWDASGWVNVLPGDCNGTDSGYYVDGVVDASSATVDSQGNISVAYTDENGNAGVFVAENAIDPLDTESNAANNGPANPGCGITVKCRGIEYGKLGKLGFQHCDAQVTDSSGAVWSLSGGPQPYGDITALNAWAISPPPNPFTGTTVYQGNSCTAAGCMIQSTQAWNKDIVKPIYSATSGPNSNTWLKGTAAGCGVSLPINTWGSIW